jgi:hypothetical protein
MKRRFSLIALLPLLATCGSEAAQPKQAVSTNGGGAVVVELFQSQGCSSCPPANAALNELADRPDVIALSFAVTYWDRLGWKDSFASPAYTDRQHAYAKALGHDGVWTPQVVINGSRDIVGNGKGELARAVSAAAPVAGTTSISSNGANVTLTAGQGSGTVWLIRYDPRSQQVAIKAGENGGRTLPHKNIVRQLVKLGSWQGRAASFALPAEKAGLRSVVLVQQGDVGKIVAAKQL